MEWEPQYPSVPSNSTGLPNQSAGTSSTRSEKVPTLNQISPSPAVTALSKLTDDELRRKGVEDLLRILRRVESDYKSLLGEHGNIIKDVNRRLQIFVLETRSLKEVNQKLQDDNQELRDLCCFLDDDRQRGRKLAREWQRFGRYTASVMRSEVAVYQEKLRELEDKQNELITENLELKELCLFLDQERVRMNGDRDEGDGSSNGTVTGHEDGVVSMETVGVTASNTATDGYQTSPSSAAGYIRELELKVCLLEQEKKLLAQRVDRNSADGVDIISSIFNNRSAEAGHTMTPGNDQSVHGSKPGTTLLRKSPVSSKPETVMHAMKVLQVHEELEKTPTEDDGLDDPEKAIVREMCNVVWRTLGDAGDIGSFNESSDSIQEPPFLTDSAGRPNFPLDEDPPYGPGQPYSYNSTQPQITSTPILVGMKQPHVGNQFLPGTNDNFAGSASYQLQAHKNSSSKTSLQNLQQQQSSQSLYTQGQNDPGLRNRQNSLSEKSATDRSRNVPIKQSLDRPDDRRNPEQKNSYFAPEVGGKTPNLLANHLPHQHAATHKVQHNLTDASSNPYPLQKPTDLTARPAHQPSQYQQPPPLPHQLQQQQRLPEKSMHSQKPADLIAKSHDQAHRYQHRPSPPHQPSSSLVGNQNQRPADPQQGKQYSGNNYSQQNEQTNAPNLAGNQPQHQRNTQPRPHQQVKLLDAPGSGRNFQRPVPALGQGQMNDRPHDDPQGHTRLHGRGDNDNLTDMQTYPPPRSVPTSSSYSSVMQPHSSQMTSQNMQTGKSTQNVKGPSVFRAYPPQLTSMPNQPVSLRAPGQELSSTGNPDPTRGGYLLEPQSQNRANLGNKRFQEQEWRQNFLDDSDTL